MSDAEFNKDMDSYIKKRRKYPAQETVSRREEPEPEPYEEPVEETLDEPLDEEPRQGFFSRLRKFFSGDEEPEEDFEEPEPDNEYLTDIKELGRITLHVIKQLPDEQLTHFKNSDRFSQFKHILEKHGLVKTK
ncbi:hypothetical protein GF342_02860 [Candidatus Woesearchaeota archaeon]|nr:hypothetical protein [Candidatus Woesearchaeota archaeon]